MKCNKNEMVQNYAKTYNIIGIIGSLIWLGTVLLRGTNALYIPGLNFLLGIAPNFGAVFVFAGLTVIFWQYGLKKEFNPINMKYLLSIILVFSLLSEIIHHYFLDSPFDIWDIAVSIVASGILCQYNKKFIKKRNSQQ